LLLSVKSSCNPKVHLVADGGAYMTVGADFSGSGPKLSSGSRAWLGTLGTGWRCLGAKEQENWEKQLRNQFTFTFSVFKRFWEVYRTL
jgi:hypothetical protein